MCGWVFHAGNALYVILYVMKVMSATELRANLAAALQSVEDDAEELVVTRAGHRPLVVVDLGEYSSLKETEYLLRSPANAERLLRAVAGDAAGQGRVRELLEADEVAGE
jgi:antitoxin YefM